MTLAETALTLLFPESAISTVPEVSIASPLGKLSWAAGAGPPSPPPPDVPSPATRLAPPPAGGADATWWNSVSVQYTLFLPSTATGPATGALPMASGVLLTSLGALAAFRLLVRPGAPAAP